MWESFAGKESLAGIEGNCETPSYYLRQSCKMPSYIQSPASTRRFGTVEGTWNYDESKELQNWKDKITRVWNAERTDSF